MNSKFLVRHILFIGFCFLLSLSHPSAAYSNQSVEAAFSPSPEAIKLVEETIGDAKVSVDVAAYSFTSYKTADALIAAHRRGVAVRVLLDKGQSKRRYRAIEEMRDAGIPIRLNYHYRIMHNKYLVIDGKTVESGSFNFTINAEKHNAENVIVIKDNKKLAQQFIENWQKLWNEGEGYQ